MSRGRCQVLIQELPAAALAEAEKMLVELQDHYVEIERTQRSTPTPVEPPVIAAHVRVEELARNGLTLWRVLGDWTRDLPLDVRRETSAACMVQEPPPSALVLDLQGIGALDSWGEAKLGDLLIRMYCNGVRVAVVIDPDRPNEYEGLLQAVGAGGYKTDCYDSTAEAAAELTEPDKLRAELLVLQRVEADTLRAELGGAQIEREENNRILQKILAEF